MCRWYCTSNGPSTNLQCLNCGTRYCAACLHGEAGKMKSLVSCANCKKVPTRRAVKTVKTKQGNTRVVGRPNWVGGSAYGSHGLGSSSASSGNARGVHGGTGTGSFEKRTFSLPGREEEELLPGWIEVVNPNWTGKHDRVYYVHSATRKTTWDKPVPPPPPPSRGMTGHSRRGVPNVVLESRQKSSSGNIFDRLTDTSRYTGAHKHRFDASGRGRGAEGRDRVAKGAGSSRGRARQQFVGNTNTNTNQTFNDLSEFLVRR